MSTIHFESVDFRVPSTVQKSQKKKGEQASEIHILKNVSGVFKGGKLTAVLGPSGSGKTSLLNLVAGRQSADSVPGAKLVGNFLLNDRKFVPTQERNRFAYVMAHDALYATLTARESLEFALQLSGVSRELALSAAAVQTKVDSLLHRLRLTDCADTLIGNLQIKGLSSGEKKRVAVGMELINAPEIFLLDEPTSGLDSHSALVLIELLKEIASDNKTVVTSIHQPSSEIFSLFDDVIFMAHGTIVYQGPVDNVCTFFGAHGYNCPADSNPADYVMLLLQTLPSDQLVLLAEACALSHSEAESPIRVLPADEVAAQAAAGHKQLPPFGTQLRVLGSREWKNLLRDLPALKARMNVAIIVTLVFSFVYFQVGKDSTDAALSVSHQGAVTLLAVNAMFSNSQIMMLSFPMERPVFLREHAAGWYGVSAYFLSKSFVEFPVIFIQVCVSTLIAYFIMALQGSFFGLVSAFFLVSVASASIALLIACVASDARRALELSPIIFVPQIFVSGFFVPIQSITWVVRWLAYISPLRYAVSIAYISEFKQYNPSGVTMIENNSIDIDLEYLYVIILIVIMIAFRACAMVALKRRAEQVY